MLPPLWLLPMLQTMMAKEEEAFWLKLDLKMGEELELGVPPPNVGIEDMGWWVRWGPEPMLVQKGPS